MSVTTIDEYLANLPDDRRNAIAAVRDVINKKLPSGYEETLQYGMISWVVPESVLPAKDVYNKQPLCLVGLASQKNHMAVYLLSVYGDEKERRWFESAYKKTGKKLDMGKSCLRFKSVDGLALDVIGEAMSHVTVDRYVAAYRKIRASIKSASATEKAAGGKGAAKRTKKAPAKKPTKKPAKKSAAKKRN